MHINDNVGRNLNVRRQHLNPETELNQSAEYSS